MLLVRILYVFTVSVIFQQDLCKILIIYQRLPLHGTHIYTSTV